MKTVSLGFGLMLLFLFVHQAGLGTLLETAKSLGPNIYLLLVIYPMVYFWNTLGWLYSYPVFLPKNFSFWAFYRIRLVGETFNSLLPWSASLGGEPLKAELVKRLFDVDRSHTYASLFVIHITLWASLNLFIGGALFIGWQSFPFSAPILQSILAFLVLVGLGASILLLLLLNGFFSRLHQWGERFGVGKNWLAQRLDRFMHLDKAILDYFKKDKKKLLLSCVFNTLAWLSGVAEVYLFSKILGFPLTLAQAWVFEMLIQVLRVITFFIPSSIGAQETGIVYLFQQFGLGTPQAMSFAILRRLREILWIGIGLVLWKSLPTPISSKS